MKNGKMKLDKKFMPPRDDEGDEFFPNGLFEFNITKMLVHMDLSPSRFPIESGSVEELVTGFEQDFDEKTVETANLASPITLAEISPGRFNVIDGNHRLEKARRLNCDTILVRRIQPEDHVAFLRTVKAYEKFVNYWSGKLSEV
jgi:hypothetical protein